MTMTKPYIGGCACGAIRYETSSKPIVESHCQCRHCQKRSGTGHGSYLVFSRRAEMSITGEAKNWRVAGDSGNEKVHAFCPTCGTPVYLTFVAMPELIAVHATSLDDPANSIRNWSLIASAAMPGIRSIPRCRNSSECRQVRCRWEIPAPPIGGTKLRRKNIFRRFPHPTAMGLSLEQGSFASRDRSRGQGRRRIRCAPAKLAQAGQAAWPGLRLLSRNVAWPAQ